MLKALGSTSITLTVVLGFMVLAVGPAQAIGMTCHDTNLGTSNAPEWERICQVTNEWKAFGANFNGSIYWIYAGGAAQSETGQVVGKIADTLPDGECASIRFAYKVTAGAPIAYHFTLASVCGNGNTSPEFACSFNRSGGCTPRIADPNGIALIQVCTGDADCSTVWKQTMENNPH